MTSLRTIAVFVLAVPATFVIIYVILVLGGLFHTEQTYGDLGAVAGLFGAVAGAVIAPWAGQRLNAWFNWPINAIRIAIVLLVVVHGTVLLKDMMGLTSYIPAIVEPEQVAWFIQSRMLMNSVFVCSSVAALVFLRDRRNKG